MDGEELEIMRAAASYVRSHCGVYARRFQLLVSVMDERMTSILTSELDDEAMVKVEAYLLRLLSRDVIDRQVRMTVGNFKERNHDRFVTRNDLRQIFSDIARNVESDVIRIRTYDKFDLHVDPEIFTCSCMMTFKRKLDCGTVVSCKWDVVHDGQNITGEIIREDQQESKE